MFEKITTGADKTLDFIKAAQERLAEFAKIGDVLTAISMATELPTVLQEYRDGMRKYLDPLNGVQKPSGNWFSWLSWGASNAGRFLAFLNQKEDYLAKARARATDFCKRYGVNFTP